MRRDGLLEHGVLKLTAVFFAVVLWLAVSGDEPAEQSVPVRLSLRTDGTVAPRGAPPLLHATVTGRRRDLLKLAPGELVLRRTVVGRSPDSVRLVLRPADVELPAGLAAEVQVRDVQPRTVMVRFDPVPRVAPAAARVSIPANGPASARMAGGVARRRSEEGRDARRLVVPPAGGASDSAPSAGVDDTLADTVWPGAAAPPRPRPAAP